MNYKLWLVETVECSSVVGDTLVAMVKTRKNHTAELTY